MVFVRRFLAAATVTLAFCVNAAALATIATAFHVPTTEPDATIRGMVRAADAAPLAGITVTAELTPTGSMVAVRTDAQGAYTLTQLAAGRYRITPVHADYRFAPPWREVVTPPDAAAVDFVGAPHFDFYLPLMRRPLPDLTVRQIELTQATQTAANDIPLVAGRPTLARVYAAIADAEAAPGIFLELAATRNGQTRGSVRQGPRMVWANPARGRYETTFNVRLPAEWLTEDVTLQAVIDPDGAFAESDESNNSLALAVAWQPVPPLRVKWVPINYTDLPTGIDYPGRWDAQELDFLQQVLPVSQVEITVRAPLDFRGDLRTHEGWSALLARVAELKLADNAPPGEVYYGLIPLGAADAVPVRYGGLGFVGYRAAIGLVGQPETTAHEIGHNLGLLHAPCGDPASVDSAYPYPGAQIGEYGVDVAGDILLQPAVYRDLMSYCGPRWISDYHYRKALQDQQVYGRTQPAPSAAGLWVRVHFTADGAPQLLPVYPLDAAPTPLPADSPYTVELLDAAGNVLATQPVMLLTAGEDGPPIHILSAVIPQPSAPVTALRLTVDGAPVAARSLAPAVGIREPVVAQHGPSAVFTWQPAARPVLMRYSTDGVTWTTLGVDLTGDAAGLSVALPDAPLMWSVAAGQ